MKTIFLISLICCSAICIAQKSYKEIGKGNEYYRTAQFDLAEKYYREALKKEPDNTTAAYNLANALQGQKRYKEAIAVLQEIKAAPDNKAVQAAVHYNTGVAHTKEKDLEASIEAYKATLRLMPDDRQARENLQLALLELKKEQQQRQQQQQRSSMSRSEAQKQLKQLQQKEKAIQERMNRNRAQQGGGMEKDW